MTSKELTIVPAAWGIALGEQEFAIGPRAERASDALPMSISDGHGITMVSSTSGPMVSDNPQ